MIPEEIYQKIVRYAVKAPSGHNTQPWQFARNEDGFFIKPDFSRALPLADPLHRELFISLGCLAETAMIAAQYYGYQPSVQIPDSADTIKISLQKDETTVPPDPHQANDPESLFRENHSDEGSVCIAGCGWKREYPAVYRAE